MRTIQQTFVGAGDWVIESPNKYFRLMTNTTPVDIKFFLGGKNIGEDASAVDAGFWTAPRGGFDKVVISMSAAQTLKIALSNGSGGYDRTLGDVSLLNTNGVMTMTAKTVTNASGSLVAQNTSRKFLYIENNDPAGIISVSLTTPATMANGILIPPGSYKEYSGLWVPTNQFYAIGSIASNANIIVEEG